MGALPGAGVDVSRHPETEHDSPYSQSSAMLQADEIGAVLIFTRKYGSPSIAALPALQFGSCAAVKQKQILGGSPDDEDGGAAESAKSISDLRSIECALRLSP